MILPDTSIWIEYLKGSPKIYDVFASCLRQRVLVALSAVFGELLQGVRNKREKGIILGFWENLPKVEEHNLFVEAGIISNDYSLRSCGIRLIDCYILVAARQHNLGIWTLDKKLIKTIEYVR